MLIGSKSLNCVKSGFLRVSYICYIFVSEQESGHELLRAISLREILYSSEEETCLRV